MKHSRSNIRKVLYVIISIAYIDFSCHQKSQGPNYLLDVNKLSQYTIDTKLIRQKSSLQYHLTNVKLIPLNITQKITLGTIDKIVIYRKKMFVLDRSFSSINIFDMKGNFLNTVGRLGRGIGEYTDLQNFIIDSTKNEIHVLVNDKQAILRYNLSGKYLGIIKTNIFASDFERFKKETFFFTNNNSNEKSGRFNLIQIDSKDQLKERFFPIMKKANQPFKFSGRLGTGHRGLLFNAPLSDTIFEIYNERISPKYFFDFRSDALSKKARYDMSEFLKSGLKSSFLLNRFQESSNYLIFSYQKKGKVSTAIFDRTKRLIIYDSSMDSGYLKNYIEAPVGLINGDIFLSVLKRNNVSTSDSSINASDSSLKRMQPSIYSAISSTKKGNSPIVILYKVKL